jgi:small subunit ribosomal protein S8e
MFTQDDAKPEAAKAEAKPADKAATPAGKPATVGAEGAKKRSSSVKRKLAKHTKGRHLAASLEDQFTTGRLYAAISSRPGQCGRADGYILEGRELEFYLKKMQKGKKGKKE